MAFEVGFYATVAVILLILPRRVIPTLLCAQAALISFYLLPLPKAPWMIENAMVLEFGLGVLVGYLIRCGLTRLWLLCLAVSAAMFAYAASKTSATIWVDGLERVFLYGGGSALAIYGVTAAEIQGFTFPKWLQYLGDISYSLYVWHSLLLMLLANFYVPWLLGPVQMALWLAATLAVSAISYRWIESPINRAAREFKKQPRLSKATA